MVVQIKMRDQDAVWVAAGSEGEYVGKTCDAILAQDGCRRINVWFQRVHVREMWLQSV